VTYIIPISVQIRYLSLSQSSTWHHLPLKWRHLLYLLLLHQIHLWLYYTFNIKLHLYILLMASIGHLITARCFCRPFILYLGRLWCVMFTRYAILQLFHFIYSSLKLNPLTPFFILVYVLTDVELISISIALFGEACLSSYSMQRFLGQLSSLLPLD